mgnify:CR=1 FL=1
MKKQYFLHVLLLFVFLFFIPDDLFSKATVANQPELNKLLEMVQIHDGTLTQWQLLAREEITISKADPEQIVARWKEHFPHFTWTSSKKDGTRIWIGKHDHSNLNTVEQLQLIVDLSTSMLHGFILYELKGNTLHDVHSINEHYLHMVTTIFVTTPEHFTSIKGKWHIVDHRETMRQLAQFLRAEEVELIEESGFSTFTARSPYFSRYLQTKDREFNVQIALRTDCNGEETTFTIGTPILTMEY